MGGTAYIREMYERYGAPGFLAAYNAGPGRYENYLTTGRPLPRETQHYVAKIAPAIGYALRPALAATREPVVQLLGLATAKPIAIPWTQAALFVENSGRINSAPTSAVQPPSKTRIERQSTPAPTPEKPSSNGLFAPLSGTSL